MMSFRNILGRAVAFALVVIGITACGGGGGGGGSSLPAASNAISVTVDTGPAGTGYNVNRLYTTVKICQSGSSTQCQTIDHVLVDTGSTGLRLLSSVLAPDLNLSRLTGSGGFPLLNCAQFIDNSFAWAPLVTPILLTGVYLSFTGAGYLLASRGRHQRSEPVPFMPFEARFSWPLPDRF